MMEKIVIVGGVAGECRQPRAYVGKEAAEIIVLKKVLLSFANVGCRMLFLVRSKSEMPYWSKHLRH